MFPPVNHIGRNIVPRAINEAGYNVATPVQFGDLIESVLIQPTFLQGPVHLFSNPAVLSVIDIFDDISAGGSNSNEVSKSIIIVRSRSRWVRLGQQLAVGGVGVGFGVFPCGDPSGREKAGMPRPESRGRKANMARLTRLHFGSGRKSGPSK